MSNLLLDERPVILQASLVRRLGIAEAAIVQQLHYWAQRSQNTHDGQVWVYKTYQEWSDEIGISAKAARGALGKLREAGVVVSIDSPVDPRDRTLWWRIEYDVLDAGPPAPGRGRGTDPSGRRPARGGMSRAGVPDGSTEMTAETTSRESAREARKRQIPDGFPEELRPHAREVMRVLKAVAEDHPTAKAVWPREVGLAIMAHPRKPLVAMAHELEGWAVDPPRPIKDVVSTYRRFLSNKRDLAAIERLADDGTPTTAPREHGGNVHPIRRGSPPTQGDLLRAVRQRQESELMTIEGTARDLG